MSTGAESGYAWYIGATQRTLSIGESRTWRLGSRVSDARYESYQADAALLREVFENSSFAGLQARCMDFMRAVASANEEFREGHSTHELTPPIRSKFDDLLSAFRRFVDRTPHALSQRYGIKSEEFATFKAATADEFDNEFSYRFIYHLRNYSDHAGSPISRITQTSTLNADGTVQYIFDVLFNSQTLVASSEWHRQVRQDLTEMGTEFSAIIIVDALLHSCGRIHCKTLLAQEVGITLAVERIRTLAAEAPRVADLGPVLMHVKIGEFIARRPVSPFNITVVRTDLADVAETALREAHEVVARLSVPLWPGRPS
jgi:hypothetical protein